MVVGSLALVVAGLTAAPPRVSALALLPVAVDDTATVVHGRTRTVASPGVLANDLQLGTGFTADLVSGPSHGNLDLAANGGYTFQADDDYVGADQFRYRVDGGLLGCPTSRRSGSPSPTRRRSRSTTPTARSPTSRSTSRRRACSRTTTIRTATP